jgi:putative transcriptional regulator
MESRKGSLLIAAPSLVDPDFILSVVIVAEHNAEGALGLILNRPGDLPVRELWSNISDEPAETDARTFVGGPVQKGAVLFLHGHEDLAPGAEPIVPGVYLGGEVELLSAILRRDADLRKEGNEDGACFRVFSGYSGWGAGQLDGELKAGGWLTLPASAEQVFRSPPERLWALSLGALGGAYKFYSLMPPDPEMN